MSVTIFEMIERECCDPVKDFQEYKGLRNESLRTTGHRVLFCKHCGQPWHKDKEPGDMDSKLIRLRVGED